MKIEDNEERKATLSRQTVTEYVRIYDHFNKAKNGSKL